MKPGLEGKVNEESGRYRELRPVFYVPAPDRKLVQEGKPGHYTFVEGSAEQHALVDAETRQVEPTIGWVPEVPNLDLEHRAPPCPSLTVSHSR